MKKIKISKENIMIALPVVATLSVIIAVLVDMNSVPMVHGTLNELVNNHSK